MILEINKGYTDYENEEFKSFQAKWLNTVDIYVNIISYFGFINTFDFGSDTYFERPKKYDLITENILIGRLMDVIVCKGIGGYYKLI